MDSESCTRAFSQARVYLEQIRSRVAPGGDVHGIGKRDYLVDAAKQIRLALERDVSEDYEEAFNHYKNGVDVLLNGIQVDTNKERREAVKRKITQYLKRAEEIFNCHLQRTLGNGNSDETGYSSLRFRPIRTLSTPIENLRRCKVVGIIDKVQIVQDPATGGTFILKSLPKSHIETRRRQTIIPHGVPFMVELVCYSVSEDSIFLRLEHVKGGTLWSHLRSHPRFQHLDSSTSDCSCPLRSPTLSLAAEHTKEEQLIGNSQEASSRSQQSCSVHPGNNGGQIPTCSNHCLLKSADQSSSQKKSPNHTHARAAVEYKGHTGSPAGPREIHGRKELSTAYPLTAARESNFKIAPWERSHSANQNLTFQSNESLITVGGISSIASPHQETVPAVPAGERFSQPIWKAARGCSTPKTETRCRRLCKLGHHLASLPQQNHMCPGTPLQNHCSQESQWEISHKREEGHIQQEKTVPDSKLHKSQMPSEQYRPTEHQTFQKHGLIAWDVNENQVQIWAAELILALEGLHQQGVLCQDLNPRNLLLDDAGHIRLTYFGQWSEVEPQYCSQALEDFYCAPEVGGISELTEACDWWSFGALLYELLSGMLLKYDPKQRLGSGEDGVSRIKSHSFFSTIQWNKLVAY
ncbi:ribosomal protein S6 kinase-like 1 isoform X2 [Sceloporus undulatus]|uniref:ribosomal protein S6 kinase-like 1 isoform X2 n=1 Tax=Sceloporus undulatus TaxID=8520 RepID=UPI001C4D9682|nr:ribosomal protein S6 kinase-like 1 isoform X2 [Sceloporus undulatus]